MCKLSDNELLLLEKGQLTCEDVEAALGDYVEGDLSETVSSRIDSHIAECEECREGLKLYRELITIASTLDSSELDNQQRADNDFNWDKEERALPEDVQDRLHAKLNTQLGLNLPRRNF